jgi:N-acetylmuramoyl-L-alanine amidase
LKVIICSGILCGYYFVALRNKRFHRWNRFFLLASVVLSLLLPLIKINIFQPAGTDQSAVIAVLQTLNYGDEVVIEYSRNGFHIDSQILLETAYILVSAVLTTIFFIALYRIKKLHKNFPETDIEGIRFIETNAKGTPFSFFNSIFWNNAIDLYSKAGKHIFNHEIAHIKEKHSYDKLFMNLVLILFWINPFFWIMRKELYMIHEFMADQKALNDDDITAFSEMILQTVYPGKNFRLTNNFFYSPLKRRLLMLTKNKNPKVSYASRLLVLPLAAIVFFAFTLKVKKVSSGIVYNDKTINVVIDAGHGGSDNGAISLDGLKEKDIALSIAKKIKDLNTNDHIKILLSRNNDEAIPLKDRVEFAKSNGADIFISIHINAPDKDESSNGFSVIIDRNNKNQLLASALINELKKSYKTEDKIKAREGNILVLDKNPLPAALIECGYLTNAADQAFITDNANQEKIAKNILDAINIYASSLNKNVSETGIKDSTSNFEKDTIQDPIYYNGKKVKNLNIINIEPRVQITYDDGTHEIITKHEALKRGFIPPPPPAPVAPVPHVAPNASVAPVPPVPAETPPPPPPLPKNALYVVDGKIVSVATVQSIDAAKIESIDVLKDEAAIKKYVAKGKKGVIEITTNPNPHSSTDTIPDKIFSRTETPASFPGGQRSWLKYITRAIQANIDSLTDRDYGTCVVKFIVSKDGRVNDVKATTMEETKLAEIAVNAIRKGPRWIPAEQNGRKVNSYRLQPVTLTNPDGK